MVVKVFGKILLTTDRVAFAHVGNRGGQPFDISVHPVHSRILIIYSIFNLFKLLQCLEYSIWRTLTFLLFLMSWFKFCASRDGLGSKEGKQQLVGFSPEPFYL